VGVSPTTSGVKSAFWLRRWWRRSRGVWHQQQDRRGYEPRVRVLHRLQFGSLKVRAHELARGWPPNSHSASTYDCTRLASMFTLK
jgi:hypothetical protein